MERTFFVGLGASGQGISALLQFLQNIPSDTGAVFIAVTHQKKDLTSKFAELIAKSATMPVVKVTRNLKVEPNHIYVIAEGTYLTVDKGKLIVQTRPDSAVNEAIDVLFRSLGKNLKSDAVGVIFWGLGHDGLEGIKAIGDEGGFVMVQMPDDSRNSEMARNAIDRDHPNVIANITDLSEMLVAHLTQVSTNEDDKITRGA